MYIQTVLSWILHNPGIELSCLQQELCSLSSCEFHHLLHELILEEKVRIQTMYSEQIDVFSQPFADHQRKQTRKRKQPSQTQHFLFPTVHTFGM